MLAVAELALGLAEFPQTVLEGWGAEPRWLGATQGFPEVRVTSEPKSLLKVSAE